MKQTWNQHVVKKENKTLVLEIIKEESPISRADIAKTTGLNKGTVSSLVSELIDEELISETGPGESSGGRRPVMLLFNQLAGYSIGLDIGVNYLLGILTDLNGNIIKETKINFVEKPFKEIFNYLLSVIDELITSTPRSPYGVIGIGIGVPGMVNTDQEILYAPNLQWEHIDLKSAIEAKYDIPVIIENEANAGAYGEKAFGTNRNLNDLIYISVGIGIGVGLILNGNLYKGNNGLSGELGHMTIEVNGLKCRCGNKGCWELYASEQALLKRAKHLTIPSPKSKELTLDELNALAESGQTDVIKLFSEIGDNLGIGINNIINTFNPKQIIIGNRINSSKKWIKSSLENRINNYSIKYNRENLNVDFSQLTTHSTALGVVAFTIEKFLEVDVSETKIRT